MSRFHFAAWRWMLPLALVPAADLVLRREAAARWDSLEWFGYAASAVFVLALACVLAAWAPRVGWGFRAMAAALGAWSAFAFVFHTDYYWYFGVHPDVLAYSHLLLEPGQSLRTVTDAFTGDRALALALLAALGFGLWVVALRQPAAPRGRWVALAGVVVLAPAFHNNAYMSQGNFVPSVDVVFSASKALETWLTGTGYARRMQVSRRQDVPRRAGTLPFDILLIVSESLRAQSTGYGGYGRGTTPRQDALLQSPRAVSFPRCYSNSTVTSESVPSIMTGVHPAEDYRKLHSFPLLYQYGKAFADTYTFILSAHAYEPASFRFFLMSPQLDRIVYREISGHPEFNGDGMDDRYLPPLLDETLAALDAGRPFVGMMHLNGTHFPYHVPEDREVFGRANYRDRYDNSILYQDGIVGALLDVLQARGRLDRTVVVFTSDHGEGFGEHRGANGHRLFYEEIIRVPCWMLLPQRLAAVHGPALRANRAVNVANFDLLPTLVELMGLARVPEVEAMLKQLLGRSLLHPVPRERLILAQNGTDARRLSEGFGMLRGTRRLLFHLIGNAGALEYYDLARDPAQRDNRWQAVETSERRGWEADLAAFPVLANQVRGARIATAGAR